jgi:hypothetical protein
MAITKRLVKGSALTHGELDGNFTELVAADAATDAAVAALDTRTDSLELAHYTHGFEDYNHAGASQTLTVGTPVKILNDGAGPFTNMSYKIPGRGDVWDTTNNRFDWTNAGIALGDTVLIRMDFSITSNNANDGFSVDLELAVGSGANYTLNVDYREWRYAGTYNWVVLAEIYMGDTNTLNFPAEIHLTADTNGDSVQYNGHYVKYTPRVATTT